LLYTSEGVSIYGVTFLSLQCAYFSSVADDLFFFWNSILPPEMVDTMAEVNDPSDKSTRGKKPQRELNRDENGNSACHIPLSG
jgi:hypothetical protein